LATKENPVLPSGLQVGRFLNKTSEIISNIKDSTEATDHGRTSTLKTDHNDTNSEARDQRTSTAPTPINSTKSTRTEQGSNTKQINKQPEPTSHNTLSIIHHNCFFNL
jgi:hypothetical protein